MSADKRKVSTDALETLGSILDDKQKRDAIHLAVEPVIAGEWLYPGAHITVENGIAFASKVGEGLGIVDPFLQERVNKGERFWFVMYPRMVHSLRHVWSHPAFKDEVKEEEVPAAPSKEESEKWLREFIEKSDCPGFDIVIAAATGKPLPGDEREWGASYENTGDYLYFQGMDAHSEIPPEFWDHIENYTGVKVPQEMRATSFSCSC